MPQPSNGPTDGHPSCQRAAPLLGLDPNGKAPILDYQLPAPSSFSFVGHVPLQAEAKLFRPEYRQLPGGSYWQMVRGLTAARIGTLLAERLRAVRRPEAVLRTFDWLELSGLETAPARRTSSQRAKAGEVATITAGLAVPVPEVFGLPLGTIAARMAKGERPMVRTRLFGDFELHWISRPKTLQPQIAVVLHYRAHHFLGNYGAGRVVKTMSLLPGEKTTISVTTFKHHEEHRKRAESVLDSWSEESADDLESTIESQSSHDSTAEQSASKDKEISGGVNLSSLGIPVDVSGGASKQQASSSVVADHVGTMNKAVTHHAAKAAAHRDVNVQTEVETTDTTDTTTATVRELSNLNHSRVLNFVFRQLTQEFLSLTAIEDVSILFTTGCPEHRRLVKLTELDRLLDDVLVETAAGTVAHDRIKEAVARLLCNLPDYLGQRQSLLDCFEEELIDCCGHREPIKVNGCRFKRGVTGTFGGFTVPGLLVDVQRRTLPTDSVIADAMLGQGEALDCYNACLQEIAVEKSRLENRITEQRLEILGVISPPAAQADAYPKIFYPPVATPSAGQP